MFLKIFVYLRQQLYVCSWTCSSTCHVLGHVHVQYLYICFSPHICMWCTSSKACECIGLWTYSCSFTVLVSEHFHVYIRVHVHVHTSVYIHVHVHNVRVHVHVHFHVHNVRVHVHLSVRKQEYSCTCRFPVNFHENLTKRASKWALCKWDTVIINWYICPKKNPRLHLGSKKYRGLIQNHPSNPTTF